MSDTTVILNDDEMGALLQALSHWVRVTRGMALSTDCAIPAGFFLHQIATLEGIVAKLPEPERAYFAEITQVGGPTEDQLIETAIELEILHVLKEQPLTSDEHENDDRLAFTYSRSTFPFHPDCYTWPRIAVYDENGATELNVHCLRDTRRRQFSLVGFIGANREDQISAVIFLAQQAGAEVIVFRGVGLDDRIVGKLMTSMVELDPEKSPDQLTACVPVDWPTRFQRRVLREAVDMGGRGDFHEEALARRMHAPVEEIRRHLQLLADIGLVSEAP